MKSDSGQIRRKRIALLLSPVNLQRLALGLRRLTGPFCEFCQIDTRQSELQMLRDLECWNPDGMIAESDPDLMETMASLGKPLVFTPGDLWVEGLGCVSVDERAVGSLAAEHLLASGYSSAAFVGFDDPMETVRRDAFFEVCRRAAVLCVAKELPWNSSLRKSEFWHNPSLALMRWLEGLPEGTGVFASNGTTARTLVEACRRLSLKLPAQIGVVTSEDTSMLCDLVYPAISQVRIPWKEIGFQAGQLVLQIAEDASLARHLLVESEGVLARESTRRIVKGEGLAEEAISVMRSELSTYRRMAWLCGKLAVDRRQLERAFSANRLKPPMSYWLDLRLDKAKRLLETDPRKTVKELAYSCGFPNVDSLSVRFRRKYGETILSCRSRLRSRADAHLPDPGFK